MQDNADNNVFRFCVLRPAKEGAARPTQLKAPARGNGGLERTDCR